MDSKGVAGNSMIEKPGPFLLESHYLPCLEYFVLLNSGRQVMLNSHENYQKQTYRNRAYILGPNKVQLLSVPVDKKSGKGNIRDVLISYDESWHTEQIQTIRTAYGKAPFFEYYFEYFEQVLRSKKKYLWDLNHEMLTLCLNLLNIDSKISDSASGQLNLNQCDNRYYGTISRKIPFIERDIYKAIRYQQLFGSVFAPNLSILDLLFCEGPNSVIIISQSTIKSV